VVDRVRWPRRPITVEYTSIGYTTPRRSSRPPGLPASRPPGLPASRPPGLPASRPPGLPASRPPGLAQICYRSVAGILPSSQRETTMLPGRCALGREYRSGAGPLLLAPPGDASQATMAGSYRSITDGVTLVLTLISWSAGAPRGPRPAALPRPTDRAGAVPAPVAVGARRAHAAPEHARGAGHGGRAAGAAPLAGRGRSRGRAHGAWRTWRATGAAARPRTMARTRRASPWSGGMPDA